MLLPLEKVCVPKIKGLAPCPFLVPVKGQITGVLLMAVKQVVNLIRSSMIIGWIAN